MDEFLRLELPAWNLQRSPWKFDYNNFKSWLRGNSHIAWPCKEAIETARSLNDAYVVTTWHTDPSRIRWFADTTAEGALKFAAQEMTKIEEEQDG